MTLIHLSYRARIVALLIGTALPVLLLAAIGLWQYVQAWQGQIVADRVALAQSSALEAEAFVRDNLAAGQTLALDQTVTDQARNRELQPILQAVVDANPSWDQATLFGPDGQPIVNAGGSGMVADDSGQAQFRQVLATDRPAIGLARLTPGSDAETMVFGIPVRFNSGERGVLRIVPSLSQLTTDLRAQAHGTAGDIAVIDRAGNVFIPSVARASDYSVLAGHLVLDAVLGGQAGESVVRSGSSDLLVAYAPVADTGWGVVVTEPAAAAFAPVRREAIAAVLALAFALLAAGAIAWVLGSRLARAYDAAVSAQALAEEAKRQRDSVLASVSHDLRSPLTAIRGQAQLQRRALGREGEPIDTARLALGLGRIEQAAIRMNGFLEELVDAARLEAGHTLALQRRPTELVGLVSGIVAEQQQTTSRHQLAFKSDPGYLLGEIDAPRIERVIANMLSNAIKYTPDGGPIDVSLRQADRVAIITVEDHGIGIPAADLPKIFERYHRASNVGLGIGGTGLGLAGARQIVEQHGGSIRIASREGGGSSFTILLPLGVAQSAPAETESRQIAYSTRGVGRSGRAAAKDSS